MVRQQIREEKNNSEEAFYVGINEPSELRREILESSKLMIHILQSQKKVEAIRLEKEKSVNDFKRVVKEINLIVAKVKKRLPRTKLRAMTKEEQLSVYKKANPEVYEKGNKKSSKETQKVLVEKETKKETAPEPKKKETELERLQSQLDDIESKLKSF